MAHAMFRPRRLREKSLLRTLVRETTLAVDDLDGDTTDCKPVDQRRERARYTQWRHRDCSDFGRHCLYGKVSLGCGGWPTTCFCAHAVGNPSRGRRSG